MKWFSCLAILFWFIVSSDANCERAQVKDCIEKYVKELNEKPDISSHCDRLRDVFGCFWSENPECTRGRMIKRWRGWVLMVRTLEKYLDLCEIDDQRLQNFYRKLPDDSIPKRFYNFLRTSIISDVDKNCARRVHLGCNKMFVDEVKNNHRICDDGRDWLQCYNNSNCNQESAIVRYAQYVGELVTELVTDCNS